MGYTYDTAATSLGVSRGTYADWIAGTSRTSDQASTLLQWLCANDKQVRAMLTCAGQFF